MSSFPPQPGDGKPKKANKPLDKQLDELLTGIEKVEPGTIDPKMLPSSFKPAKKDGADAVDAVEAAIETPAEVPPAEVPAEVPAEAAPVEAEAVVTPAEPAADATTPEQADMLAALNSALQGIGEAPPAEAEAPATPVPDAPADDAMSMEDKLQQEIAALMNAEPQVAEDAASTPAVTDSATSSTEDQIAKEIEGLLNTGPAAPAASTAVDTADDTAIDELDKMLAQEIDADDELVGDFHSVEDITAGIQVPDPATAAVDDTHAATARDVAAELDNQPEDLPEATIETVHAAASSEEEDPFAVLAEIAETAEKNEKAHQRRLAMQAPNWQHWLEIGRERLLDACYAINWPARRFLSNEWRSILGIIALMNLCTGLGFWVILILF